MSTAKKKYKLLLVITKSNWGGAQKYVHNLATNLLKEDFDIAVALGGDGILKKELLLNKIKVIDLIWLRRNIKIFSDFMTFWNLIKIIQKEKPDILHLNSSKIGVIGSLAGRIIGVNKIIFTAHGWAFNEDRPFLQKTIIKFLQIITVFLCHRVITVSSVTKEQLKIPSSLLKKTVVVYNGIQKNLHFKKKNDARTALLPKRKHGDFILIGTISELTKNKGLQYAISAFSMLKSNKKILFIIIGEGEDKEKLEAQIKEKGLHNRVFIKGFIKDAYQYLKAFDLFLLSSIKEGLPYVVLEAGAAKIPIISTNVGGISEIIDDLKDGLLVKPSSSQEIFHALNFLIKNEEKRIELGNKLAQKIEDLFSIDKMVSDTKDVYLSEN